MGTKEQKAEIAAEEARQAVIDQYEEQHGRGQKGFGTLCIEDGKVKVRRATEPVKAFFDIRDSKGDLILFHHRMPTSTDNMLAQTHPIFVPGRKNKNAMYVMHNGVIQNDDELKEEHEKLGFDYQTEYIEVSGYTQHKTVKFNDSEAFAIELARVLRGESQEIGALGTIAFFAVEVSKTGKPIAFHYGRNEGNPLHIEETASGILIASEAQGELVAPYELNTRVFNKGVLGAASRTALAFKKREIVVATPTTRPAAAPSSHNHTARMGFGVHAQQLPGGANYHWPEGDEQFDMSALSKKQEKKLKDKEDRVSLFHPNYEGPEFEKYQESMEMITDTMTEAIADIVGDFMSKAMNGEAAKKDLTATMKEVAAVLNSVIQAEDNEEERVMGYTQTKQEAIMAEIEADAEAYRNSELEDEFGPDDLPFQDSMPTAEEMRADPARFPVSAAYEADLRDHWEHWGRGHKAVDCKKSEYHTIGQIREEMAEAEDDREPHIVY